MTIIALVSTYYLGSFNQPLHYLSNSIRLPGFSHMVDLMDWFTGKKLQGNIVVIIKLVGGSCKVSLKPIHRNSTSSPSTMPSALDDPIISNLCYICIYNYSYNIYIYTYISIYIYIQIYVYIYIYVALVNQSNDWPNLPLVRALAAATFGRPRKLRPRPMAAASAAAGAVAQQRLGTWPTVKDVKGWI